MLDHFGIPVRNVAAAAAFYDIALAPLGAKRVKEVGELVCFGTTAHTLWLVPATEEDSRTELHVAFAAPDRETVDAFYEAAVGAGYESLHAPAVHPEYHETYYGAFVRDPDGNNVEAVCHTPPQGT